MKVELVTPENYSDDFIVDCARVSYSKKADQFTPKQNEKLLRYLNSPPDSVPHWAPFAGPRICFDLRMSPPWWVDFFCRANLAGFSWVNTEGNTIRMNGSLWAWKENLHIFDWVLQERIKKALAKIFPVSAKVFEWDDFSDEYSLIVPVKSNLATLTYESLRVTAPIFVTRQLVKHQVHLVWSEVSRRYVKDRPDLYWPEGWNKAPKHSKQGASTEQFGVGGNRELDVAIAVAKDSVNLYCTLIEQELAPEQARMLLPQNMMTEWIWTGSISAFQRVCRERLAPGTQGATRQVAAMIDSALAEKHGPDWRQMK
jgi:thymidylate synthase (FAD)